MKHAAPCLRIVLVGFMGAGKSTVAGILGKALGWQVIDLDAVIAAQSGMTLPEIFSRHGQAHFRRLETDALIQALHCSRCVIAAGGGSLDGESNRALLKAAAGTRAFYLEAPLAELQARCAAEPRQRPLLGEADTLFARRGALYADIGAPVSTFGFSAEQVAQHILSLLQMDNALAP